MILPEHESNRLLSDAGIPVISGRDAKIPGRCKRQAETLG